MFQIEEPDGSPADPNAPGAAVGIDVSGPVAQVAVDEHAVTYAKLTVDRTLADGSWLGVSCTPASSKRDGLPIPLRPPRYLATDAVAASEDWARAARLLTRLANPPTEETGQNR